MGDPSVHQFCDYLQTSCDCPRHAQDRVLYGRTTIETYRQLGEGPAPPARS